ncbi:hypothetical protein GFH30_12470 [Acinetobacter wanghuae]|uniref:Uncharacterized protein n=1 Tax=Acinetobacter wanghuae TaxID=2662362 RepID=A0A5Q0P4N7_9GAMM|nr:hypothetical protein [Acinetobacter wanghuae]MQW93139.1 hypothetical protein [Acinetobacter wanghuae]QGA12125.1 hypothetical protein GFH30_12470 [Acinetobacter wanghuae]
MKNILISFLFIFSCNVHAYAPEPTKQDLREYLMLMKHFSFEFNAFIKSAEALVQDEVNFDDPKTQIELCNVVQSAKLIHHLVTNRKVHPKFAFDLESKAKTTQLLESSLGLRDQLRKHNHYCP